MITREAALRITSESFPNGPEELANRLSVEVCLSPLVGVEGWCVRGPTTVIRLNSSSSKFRQRFTLSHELAHLVLGTVPDIATEPFRSDRAEEREVDKLASQFLIPDEQLLVQLQGKLPIDATALKRLAKTAKVSPVVAACRVAGATDELGLKNAAVVFFINEREQWRYSHGLRFNEDGARSLLDAAMKCRPKLARERNADGNVVVGSIIDAQSYQVLFIQLLSEDEAGQDTYEEQMRALAAEVFETDKSFQQSVAASLGTVKKKCAGQSLNHAFDYFMHNYAAAKYTGHKRTVLLSDLGRRYVRLYLQRWFN